MPDFFEQPILNSPYAPPARRWELDDRRQPTDRVVEGRRPAEFIAPVPKPRRRGGQRELAFGGGEGQQYELTARINEMRRRVGAWRALPDRASWQVTPETARLLAHWRTHDFRGPRPFFCQIEAVETLIWLTEVAPKRRDREARELLRALERASEEANPGLSRLALKLATGAGKTTVMAMIVAWQTVNAVRRPGSPHFTRGFLVVTPGITIRDRLRVLQPHDPGSYYRERELVPHDLLPDLAQARIVITNYHAFRRRDRASLPKGARGLLEGRGGPPIAFGESEGEMLRRVMPELMGMKRILALSDEAHHCYRERPGADSEEDRPGADERDEAARNREAARLWISGLEAAQRRIGLQRVVDLSATPFFLRGSGYAEGTLFPWTVCDFSLMDAIECGIVKLPRVPVADNIPGGEMPVYRDLWRHVRGDMPRTGRRKAGPLDPLALPAQLRTALEALYGHYRATFELWREAREAEAAASGAPADPAHEPPPPCFIVVCNNTAASKLVTDYIAGFERADGGFQPGALPLFRNFDEQGRRLPRMRTLLIDSQQLESGEGLDRAFREAAAGEIERFRQERAERTGETAYPAPEVLLREVMNTVGRPGRLGGGIRCVVSVGMLTEGWDANTVTHVLGVRAFGTQLLCEQVVGRALRRQSYDLNEDGRFDAEYADVLGVPFDFTAKPVAVKPAPPRGTVRVHAVSPERDALEIRFPRVEGYRVELPDERLDAEFGPDSTLELTPERIGPTHTLNRAVVGEGVDLNLAHTADLRRQRLLYLLTRRLLQRWREPGEAPRPHLFGQLRGIAGRWLDEHLVCAGGTHPAQLLYDSLADDACERITAAIVRRSGDERAIRAVLAPYDPEGSTRHVRFTTSKPLRWTADPRRSHLNLAICDSEWELQFCRAVEAHPRVLAYARNDGLGFEIPYRTGGEQRRYRPDFIVLVDDGRGADDPLCLVVEIKGFRREHEKDKRLAMETYWIPGVNNLRAHGRWAFAELDDVWTIESELAAAVDRLIARGAAAGTAG